MKRFAAITLALIMALICVPVMAEKADREIEGNLAVFTTAEDFAAGKLENVVTDESIGNGAIVLKEGESEGTYTSEVLGTAPFEYMVAYPHRYMDRGFRPRVRGHEKGLDGMAQLGQMERQRKARLRVRRVRFGLYGYGYVHHFRQGWRNREQNSA